MVNKDDLRYKNPEKRHKYKRKWFKKYYEKNKEYLNKRSREYHKNVVQKRKIDLVVSLGGKCQSCGYKKVLKILELHHINPADKEGEHEMRRKGFVFKPEKYKLLCPTCHREIHQGRGQNE